MNAHLTTAEVEARIVEVTKRGDRSIPVVGNSESVRDVSWRTLRALTARADHLGTCWYLA